MVVVLDLGLREDEKALAIKLGCFSEEGIYLS